VEGRGDRMGQALPESNAGGFRDRDPSGVRGGGFRRRVHPRAEGAGEALARADRREEEKVAGGAGPGARRFHWASFVVPLERGFSSGRKPSGSQENGEIAMRFMMIVKATKDSEAGVMPSEKLM